MSEDTQKEETVEIGIDQLREVVKAATEETVNARLEELGVGKVNREKVAVGMDGADAPKTERSEGRPFYGEAARFTAPEDHMYRTLPEWEQKYRNADTDHWCARWFRGVAGGDREMMREAHGKLNEYYGRDLNTTSDSSLVPSPIANTVMELRRKMQLFGPRAMILSTGDETLKVPKELTFSTVQKLAEGTAGTTIDPTFDDINLAKKNTFIYTATSNQMLEATPFALVQLLTRGASKSLALEADLQDVEKGGTAGAENQTDSILDNGSVTETTFATVGTLDYLEVNKFYRAVPSEYRANAVFIGNNTVGGFLDDLLDSNGRPIFDSAVNPPGALEGGQGNGDGVIKRKPFLEIGITADVLIFGDPQAYIGIENPTIRAEISRDVRFLEDQIVYKWVMRRDGAVGQAVGFAKTPAITTI